MTNLKKARLIKGISQKELAITLKVAQPTVSAWESGKKTPTKENLKILCELLETTADYLLGITDNEQGSILNIPTKIIKDTQSVLFRDEFKDLTQDEVDTLAVLAKTLKEKRKKKEDETVTIAVAARSKNNDEPVKIIKVPKKDLDILDTAPKSDEIL